uniref:Uncharacterized protein n=1 Tax=Anopheles culicifacies TaxID=139723 RepID=A0A182MM72_9DIPT
MAALFGAVRSSSSTSSANLLSSSSMAGIGWIRLVVVLLGRGLYGDGRTVGRGRVKRTRHRRLIEGVGRGGDVAAVVTGCALRCCGAAAVGDRLLAYVGQTPAAEIGQPRPQRGQIDRARWDTLEMDRREMGD